jgi:hypothetical protein
LEVRTSVAVLAAVLTVGSEPAPTSATPDLWAEAWLSTAGPYGQGWSLRLAPSGNVSLRVFYMGTPAGSLLADFDPGDGYEARVRAVLNDQQFFVLPAEITPKAAMLHMPDFSLNIGLGSRRHKVRLYDPEQMKSDPRAKRFLAVWTALFDGLPVKPSW